ncbi:hypothetical protein MOQ_004715 [Trypanosoma cruzi marinkellei]|uniref:CAP-Gly domain-containing protein n=1 Tax=Trypanosoma cruzi marinkellei TaxID=85056 RepID=K2N0A1_TRYCR|nr:hypothetical protein MOQ_004715 [Trypanosoma cruzi marinkellei]
MLQASGCELMDFVSVLPVPPQTERRRGVLRFVGPTDFAPGLWMGIELFGTIGRNDGSVMGKSYFSCPAGQGVFVRPELVVPYMPEGEGHSGTVRKGDEFLAVVEPLRADLRRMQEELQQREAALQEAREELRNVLALHDAKSVELEREREEKSRMKMMTMTACRNNVTATTQTDEDETVELKDLEIHRLQQQCADLKDLCELQEDEIHRQREHADDLAQIVENLRREHEEERARMLEKIRSLEEVVEEITQRQKVTAEESAKADVEDMHLHAFQQQQEKEALRILKERYEQLYAERESERQEQEAKWKRATAEYEEALTQQREYKNRLLNEIRQLQHEIKDVSQSRERERVLQMPLSTLERDEYESQIYGLQWELMEVHEEMFSKRYDHFLVPVSNWNLPADVMRAMREEIMSSERVLPFTTPEKCQQSRMVLFQMHPRDAEGGTRAAAPL